MKTSAFFNTHHSPVGAWASLTFGAPDLGMSIDLQDPIVKKSGFMMAGMANERGIRSIGFIDMPKASHIDLKSEGTLESERARAERTRAMFGFCGEEEISRVLTPSKDIFTAGNITFTVYTPYDELPDPDKGEIPAIACLPGILMDVTVDNTDGDLPCTAFFGMGLSDAKRSHSFEENGLVGHRHKGEWAFAAREADGAYLVRGLDAVAHLKNGTRGVHQNGPAFLCIAVPAGEKRTLTLTWSVYAREGSSGTWNCTYYYNRFFGNLLEGAKAVLDAQDALRAISEKVDGELLRAGQDEARVGLFCQAVRSYYASSQLLLDEENRVRWNVGEGAYVWRNTIDLCADHITWELRRNPWIVRSLMDEFIDYYSYTDTVTFAGIEGEYPGGVSFTHDMGCYFDYSPVGYSDYEHSNETTRGFYFYMTTEELLNGIYCMAGYALHTGDREWMMKRKDLLPALMESLENRDGFNDEMRNGVLKASSTRGGKCGLESTTYDALDHSLLEAAGNLYVYIKTWCSLILLKKCCALIGDAETAARADRMLDKCRASVKLFRTDAQPWLKANAYRDLPGAVSAAAEPLSVPHMLGALDENTDPVLTALLREHSLACLEKGVCRDAESGGLRLSSTSRNTWTSKVVLTLYAIERVLGLELPEGMAQETINWGHVSARETTVSDQIYADTRQVLGGLYYPRIVTTSLWL
ncbi:MAG: hypothetical protein IJE08_09045 [Clostridia bacterium]|nr:hypothetical protein [Clostridia bacterium]